MPKITMAVLIFAALIRVTSFSNWLMEKQLIKLQIKLFGGQGYTNLGLNLSLSLQAIYLTTQCLSLFTYKMRFKTLRPRGHTNG